MNFTAAALALLSGAALAAAGCAIDKRTHRSVPASQPVAESVATAKATENTTATDQAIIADHLIHLERKISQLEQRLGHGQGALRAGPNRLVDGGGNESVLERLRRVESELSDSKMTVRAQNSEIDLLREQAAQAVSRGNNLSAQSDSLSHVKDHLVTAQQELAARKAAIIVLDQQVASIELQRLLIEQRYFTTAAGLLKLVPGQSQELLDLQAQIRRQIKDFKIETQREAKTEAKAEAKTGKGAP